MAIICFFSIYHKALSHFLENKTITCQCLSGGIIVFSALFCSFIVTLCYSLLLFCLIHCLKCLWFYHLIYYVKKTLTCTFFCSSHNRKLSKSRLIRHLLNFLKALNSWSNDLVVKVLDSQSRGPRFKTTGWLQDQLGLSSFWGWSVEYLELLKTEW